MRAPRPLRVALVGLLALALSGCTGLVDQVRREVAGAGDSDASTGNTRVWDLVAGDCLDDPDGDTLVRVQTRACTAAHDDEVVAVERLTGAQFPGDLRIDKLGQILCRDDLVEYVGRDFASSALDYWYLGPTAKDWNSGHHELICYAYDWAGDTLRSSVHDSKL